VFQLPVNLFCVSIACDLENKLAAKMPPKTDFDKLLSAFLDVAQNQMTTMQNDISDFKVEIADLKVEVKDLNDEIKDTKKNNADLMKTVGDLVTENIEMQNENKTLNNKIQLFHGLVSQLKEKVRNQEE
jgi:septal ring factor EnvC (AmiA/AmiB activator)